MADVYLDDAAIDSLKVSELKEYLRKHGQFVSGRRQELVERSKGVSRLNFQSSISITNSFRPCRSLAQKLLTPLNEVIPNPLTLIEYSDAYDEIPPFTEATIYNYFTLKHGLKPAEKSRIYVVDRHVYGIAFHPVTQGCSHCIVRCRVIPSIPTSHPSDNPDHDVWVCLSKTTGQVHSAHCTCTSGDAEVCNHIAALLHCLVCISKRNSEGALACTSRECLWNKPRKRNLSPQRCQDVNYKRQKLSDISLSCHMSALSIESKNRDIKTVVNVDRFKQKLVSKNSNAGWLVSHNIDTRDQEHSQFFNLKAVDVNFCYADYIDLKSESCRQHFISVFQNISISVDEACFIEKETMGQHKNKLWQESRQQRLTSSHFGEIVCKKPSTAPDNILKGICGYVSISELPSCKWGVNHEPAARVLYAKERNVKVKQCGLIVNPDMPHLGASPDGIVFDPDAQVGVGLLEIKCPASDIWRFQLPIDCAKDPKFYCYVDGTNVKLKRTHKYYFQIQGQLAITGRNWCDFMVWTLKGFSVERIVFDKSVWYDMLPKLNDFFVGSVLPELFSLRVKRGIPLLK